MQSLRNRRDHEDYRVSLRTKSVFDVSTSKKKWINI